MYGSGRRPRIVSPEAPYVALKIDAGIASTAVILITDIKNNLCTVLASAGAMRICILNDHVNARGILTAQFSGRAVKLSEIILFVR
jgi:hypothetical protein